MLVPKDKTTNVTLERGLEAFPPQVGSLPETLPRPEVGPASPREFVQYLTGQEPDVEFEVVLGRPRVITFKTDLGNENTQAQIAVGDPAVVDFEVLNIRQIRLVGFTAGLTDLTIIRGNENPYVFRVKVIYDLDVLKNQLGVLFPEASIRLAQIREHVVVEGEARDSKQVAQILDMIRVYLTSMAANMQRRVTSSGGGGGVPQLPQQGGQGQGGQGAQGGGQPGQGGQGGQQPANLPNQPIAGGGAPNIQATFAPPQLINLLRVPTTQQVLLQVKIMSLNRSAMRDFGIDWIAAAAGTAGTTGGRTWWGSIAEFHARNPPQHSRLVSGRDSKRRD